MAVCGTEVRLQSLRDFKVLSKLWSGFPPVGAGGVVGRGGGHKEGRVEAAAKGPLLPRF